jgi:hypothetical protein
VEDDQVSVVRTLPTLRWSPVFVAAAAFAALLLGVLVIHFAAVLDFWLASLRYAFGLDYGEGIVWQQALLIPSPHMYGDINQFPYIVFHYPPAYHLAVRAIASLGVDWLMAGRGLSVASALLTGVLAAALTHRAVRRDAGPTARTLGAAIAGLITFTYVPVVIWAPLMRVDMFAVAISFCGIYCAVRSLDQPRLLYCAVALFVLAIYTKQTAIAAPLATLPLLLLIEPRQTIRAAGVGAALAVAALVLLEWQTGGGFLRHILLYNINRYSLPLAALHLGQQGMHAVYCLIAVAGVVSAGHVVKHSGLRALREPCRLIPAIFVLYFALATVMLATVGKSGATINYFIEWMCTWSVLIGVFITPLLAGAVERPLPAFCVIAALLMQVLALPAQPGRAWAETATVPELQALVGQVRAASAPVISDDMVLLMRAGKPVSWEPAIFAELAATGAWQPAPFMAMIRQHRFAFVITTGRPGEPLYDSRYSPEVSAAIYAAYPRIEQHGRMVVHLPSAPAQEPLLPR